MNPRLEINVLRASALDTRATRPPTTWRDPVDVPLWALTAVAVVLVTVLGAAVFALGWWSAPFLQGALS